MLVFAILLEASVSFLKPDLADGLVDFTCWLSMYDTCNYIHLWVHAATELLSSVFQKLQFKETVDSIHSYLSAGEPDNNYKFVLRSCPACKQIFVQMFLDIFFVWNNNWDPDIWNIDMLNLANFINHVHDVILQVNEYILFTIRVRWVQRIVMHLCRMMQDGVE